MDEYWYDYKYDLERIADKAETGYSIWILRKLYLDNEMRAYQTPKGLRIANDDECLQWMIDYWNYVRWCEHGNECSLSEVEFSGFVDTILDPKWVSEYLMYDGPETDDPTVLDLNDRLMRLHRKYGGKR